MGPVHTAVCGTILPNPYCMLAALRTTAHVYPKWTLAIAPRHVSTYTIHTTHHSRHIIHDPRRTSLAAFPAHGSPRPPLLPVLFLYVRHMGQNLHTVHSVESGERHVLIMWCRSGPFREKHCPCCLLNRANQGETNNCVVGPTWRGYYSKI